MKQNHLTRREWLKTSGALIALGANAIPHFARSAEAGGAAIDIGARRELFVDTFLIDRLTGVELKLHIPEPKDVALVCDAPWEGNTSGYFTVFRDDDRFRMYYRGWHYDEGRKALAHPDVTCLAESADGIRWTKPELGLFEFNGSKKNNIVWAGPGGTHNFTVFKDANPDCPPAARYKALGVAEKGKKGLLAFQSADGIRWSLLTDAPVITAGAFDSQNLAFWDDARGEYRAYWRIFSEKVRAIRTATSKDFLHWEHQADLHYVDSPTEHLYTNAIRPYFRAPHLFLGFPTRFQPKNQQVEPVFMSSRDGVLFDRWSDPLIPITAPKDRDGNRSNYMTWGLVQLPGQDREISVYATEAYYAGPGGRVRRFTFRTDGFVSVHTREKSGGLLTKPLRYAGKELELNHVTGAAGSLRVELQDAAGRPLPGFTLEDCDAITGDEIARIVKWKKGADVSAHAGQTVRLRFEMSGADLFSLKFNP
jgi:hypothetical protein